MYCTVTDDGLCSSMMLGLHISILAIGAVIFQSQLVESTAAHTHKSKQLPTQGAANR